MLETIKSYLVSLGFSVDKNSFNDATKVMDAAEHSVAKFAGSAVTKFAGAGVAVASFAVAATVGIAKFISSLGEAQIKNEMLARQMWTTDENAMAFNSTLKAMNATLQDLYLSPTLAAQFTELRKQAFSMQPPAEYKNQMELIQSITFEFKRMKLEGTYALQWIGYYFIKYMSGPILQVKLTLADINDKIVKTMPTWTKVVAEVMSWFARMGIAVVRTDKEMVRAFDEIGAAIPKNLKLIAGAIAALSVIIETGPVGILVAIFVALILLLDDFYTYLDGGQAKFGPFWQKLIDFYNKLKDSGAIDQFKKGFSEAIDFIEKAITWLKAGIIDFYTTMQGDGTIDNVKQTFVNTFGIISDLIVAVIGWVVQMWTTLSQDGVLIELWNTFKGLYTAIWNVYAAATALIKKFLEMKGTQVVLKVIGDVLTLVVETALQAINQFLQEITSGLNIIAKLLKGDFKGAGQSFSDLLHGKGLTWPTSSAPSYIYPNSNTQTNTSNKVEMSQTNNIYGTSDPRASADRAQENFQMMAYRNLKGVFG